MVPKTNYSTSSDRPVHVLEIVGNSIVGGMEKYVENLARHLPERGFKLSVVVPYESVFTDQLRQMGSQVFVTEMDTDPRWRSIQFVVQLIEQLDVDLIHAHLPRAHVLAGLAGKLTGIPAVATIHGMEVEALELGVARTTGSYLILVCQQAYANALALGMPADRLALIPNGVDLQRFQPGVEHHSLRDRLEIPEDTPLVGFVGRLSHEKGPDQFVRFARRVLDAHPQVHFMMAGEGPMEQEVRDLIREFDLQDHLHLLGLVEDPAKIYPELDLFVQTSRIEGMPFVLLEAMSAGLPVLALNVGGVGELVVSGVTGLLSAEGDWAGLADAAVSLLDDPEKMHRMGRAGRRRVEGRYSLHDSMDQIALLLRQLDHSVRTAGEKFHSLPALSSVRHESG